jgi:hypothetical protein
MSEGQQPAPRWILIVSGLFAFLEVAVSLSLWFSPQMALESVDLDARGVGYVISMWAARQFALGVIFGYATWKKSIPMLTLAYVFFFVMFLGDLLIGISHNDNSLIISAIAMCVVAAAMLYAVNRRK